MFLKTEFFNLRDFLFIGVSATVFFLAYRHIVSHKVGDDNSPAAAELTNNN
jgi:hypothetical protein